MCAQRMLRSGPSVETIKSGADPRGDDRQGVLGLDPGSSHAEQMVYRLAHENAQLRSRLALAGLDTATDEPVPAAQADHGRNSKPDPIAQLAASFAAQVAQLSSIQSDRPNDQDAASVNASIEMIAEEADALVTAVIEDAEDHGLEASGPWLKIPLVEAQAFEVPKQDATADEADAMHDRTLNA